MITRDDFKDRLDEIKKNHNTVIKILDKESIETINEKEKKSVSEQQFILKSINQHDLKMAIIADSYIKTCYSFECNLLQLEDNRWYEQLASFQPELLFIEAVAKENSWHQIITRPSKEFQELIVCCHNQKIPVVFWNDKELFDNDEYANAAAMADFIFTVDIDSIPKYQQVMANRNVYLLNYAAQTALFNPIEKGCRIETACCAKADYANHSSFEKAFLEFKKAISRDTGLLIKKPSTMPLNDDSGKYTYGLVQNAYGQSQTSFNRNVFDFIASNTVTIANYARGQKNYFGDLSICSDNPREVSAEFNKFCKNEGGLKKYRLLGLRRVLSDHLYEDRLDYVIQKVFGQSIKNGMPLITVFAASNDINGIKHIISNYKRQTYKNKCLFLFSDITNACDATQHIKIVPFAEISKMVGEFAESGYTTVFSEKDWYGENYILDLALTLRYSVFDVVGKSTYYQMNNHEISIMNTGNCYRMTDKLDSRCSIVTCYASHSFCINEYFEKVLANNYTLFSTDEFNYCRDCGAEACREANDMEIVDQGQSIQYINKIAEGINSVDDNRELCESIPLASIDGIDCVAITKIEDDSLLIESSLGRGDYKSIFFNKKYDSASIAIGPRMSVQIHAQGSLDIIILVNLFDDDNEIKTIMLPINRKSIIAISSNVTAVQFGLQIRGAGSSLLSNMKAGGDIWQERNTFISRSEVLLLTNKYPSYNDLYCNSFVNERMKEYLKRGYCADIMRMESYASTAFREFEGINIVEGHADRLDAILAKGLIKTVCVHFLDPQMFNILKEYVGQINIIIWCHGYEIQPWWRRTYNFSNEKELQTAKEVSEKRMLFWKEVFSMAANHVEDIHFVFVSKYFAEEVFEDNKIRLKDKQYSIIHNSIDTDLYKYEKKDQEQRKHILSIKTYSTRKYANDITKKAILLLSKESFFSELTFDLYGDGVLFHEDTDDLKQFSNVHINQTFLSHQEIAEIHKSHGIFIATTRMDAQGVSRDEAMSSGLVPIASNVAAIPEFVDDKCGVLVLGEDPQAVADAIKKLYYNPELFERLSFAASQRVRHQTSPEYTIAKEIALIWPGQEKITEQFH